VETAVPPPSPDSDPLLEFSSEPDAQVPAAQQDALCERVDKLERSLARAGRDIAGLRSQVATLVSATKEKPRPRSRQRALLAAAAFIFGVALASWSWTYATTSTAPILLRAAPVEHQPSSQPIAPVEPAAATPAPPPAAAAPVVVKVADPIIVDAPARSVPREEPPAASGPIEYVGTLSIDASPGGKVFVNGKAAGHTPLRLENLKAGAHLIWIEHDGYRRWTKVVEVPANRISRVFADLEPLASR
jgi:hypothetical protein